MAKLKNYNGSVGLMAGITQKDGSDFAMVEAGAVQTREDGTRLDAELQSFQTIVDTYILIIDYDTLLKFDTSEIVIGSSGATTAVLGKAILGSMVLGQA